VLLIPMLLAGWLAAGGCNVKTRHKVLSKVFDGVPPPRQAPPPSAKIPVGDQPTASTVEPAPAPPPGSLHQPYADRECNSCHNAGRSNQLRMPADLLCQQCHDPAEFNAPWIHGPIAGGGCAACHLPHRSDKRHLLRNGGNNFCLDCHDPNAGLMDLASPAHLDIDGKQCLDCHEAHGGDTRFLLRNDSR
jgi:predicted CXXCH cytochrome family protein